MGELLPILCGLLTGVLVGFLRPSLRIPVGASLAIVLGVVATVVSGEFRIGWEFLLIDIPLVAVSATIAHIASRAVRLRQESHG